MKRLAIFLCSTACLFGQQYNPPSSGSGPCVLSGSQTSGYVLTATDSGTACAWQTVGGASVDNNTLKNASYIADGGTTNHITGTTTTAFPGAYAAGQTLIVKAANSNSGAVDINVNSLGVKAVTKLGSTALASGNIVAGNDYVLSYDGTRFQVLNFTIIAADIPTLNQNTSGNAATATALATTPAQCSSGNAPQGVAANGDAQNCTAYQTALSNPVTGSGSTNAIPLRTGSTTLGDSNLTQNADGANLAGKAITWAAASKPTFNGGGTTTCDLSQSNLCEVDFGAGNTTLAFSNPHGGGYYLLRSCQDVTGGRTYTFAGTMKGFVQPDPVAGTTNCTEQPFSYDGTNYQGGAASVPNSAWKGISALEAAAPSGLANYDLLYADSLAHRLKMNNNNGGAVQVVASGVDINTLDQVTATHLASALPVNQGGTGTTSTLTGLVRGNSSAMTAAELSGDATTSGSNAVSVVKVNGNTPGNTCTNQFTRSIDSSARGACASIGGADLPTANRTYTRTVIIGDPGSASPALADDNDSPVAVTNDLGVDVTITAVACWANAGSPTVTPILTGGTGTSILSGALTCGTAAWAAGTVNGSPVLHSFSSGATCSSTPCSADVNITTAGGTAKYIVVKITGSF